MEPLQPSNLQRETAMNLRLLLTGLMLATSTAVLAQNPAPSSSPAHADKHPHGERGGHRMRDCAKAEDPAKCEARRKEMREQMSKARDACQGKEGQERGACMATQMCAKAPDPAKCEANAKERGKRMTERHEKRHQDRRNEAPKT